jgi:predicted esterase
MNRFSQKTLTFFLFFLISQHLFAQEKSFELSSINTADQIMDHINENDKIDADSTFKLLSNWSNYPTVNVTGRDYIYYYSDPAFGKIPMHVYIPASYKNTQKNACILLLHGAVGQSHFSDIDSLNNFDDDIFYNTLKTRNYIVIRPIADKAKDFNWASNKYNGSEAYSPNLTFKCLTNILLSLKKILNIDDSKVFVFGHSDGADGAIGLGVYSPNIFAAIIAYNSMLNNLFARDFFIRNVQNRPLYIVHSDLDDLRPIQQTRVMIDSLLKFDSSILYKEYNGYQHFDKHLEKDLPYACVFIKSISRNPFRSYIYWETEKDSPYNTIDWIKVDTLNIALPLASWHTSLNFKSYDKRNKQWMDFSYYNRLNKSGAVKATYNNNTFNVETSGVEQIELLISPVMVNLEEPVVVILNGKQEFKDKVKMDKGFIIDGFKKTFDREAIWVNSIKVKVVQ